MKLLSLALVLVIFAGLAGALTAQENTAPVKTDASPSASASASPATTPAASPSPAGEGHAPAPAGGEGHK
jgi:hypothetical protein